MTEFHILKDEIKSCRICRSKFGFEPHPIVFGNENAKIMQISQAPSKSVHETYKPFNDASGKKLRGEWYEIEDEVFYNPDNFYIVSVGHCYPGKLPSGGDRQPPQICAKKWLTQELKAVNNKIYIVVGGVAANFFFPKQNFTSLVFENKQINGKPTFILPHPSPLNRKWFKDNPQFESKRIVEIRNCVRNVLHLE